ncbi:ubiquinone biosynthesis mitochondrial [Brachionus plicatilis]|uniref:Ubiquinone biosynthesis protein n=1 Tax=Brachionus plicatilis TaxID=10195 RepID=A0A3M7T4G3_BRAPC|nr:ubiquinone biosynthesis mitochondrial [Brachionus plicatilis]
MLKRLTFFPKLIRTSTLFLDQSRFYLPITSLNKLKSNHANNQVARFESTEQQFTEEQENDETVEDAILKNALKFVPEYGFTSEAISKGAIDLGLSSASQGIFSKGSFDLIDFFYKKSNKDLEVYLEDLIKKAEVKRKNELIRSGIIFRLNLIQPYIKHWPQAMAIQTFYPSNAIVAIENLLRLCDQIWHQVGDNSTDMNWYTKRLTLAAVYKSTELFMIQDKSENFKDTYRFLDNRLKDLGSFNKIKSNVTELSQTINGSLSVLKNMLNLRN